MTHNLSCMAPTQAHRRSMPSDHPITRIRSREHLPHAAFLMGGLAPLLHLDTNFHHSPNPLRFCCCSSSLLTSVTLTCGTLHLWGLQHSVLLRWVGMRNLSSFLCALPLPIPSHVSLTPPLPSCPGCAKITVHVSHQGAGEWVMKCFRVPSKLLHPGLPNHRREKIVVWGNLFKECLVFPKASKSDILSICISNWLREKWSFLSGSKMAILPGTYCSLDEEGWLMWGGACAVPASPSLELQEDRYGGN